MNLEGKSWWVYLDEDLRELIKESMLLSDDAGKWKIKFHDYSFIVFPAAKAYEGFLKKLFYERGFITKEEYLGKKFRIGRALNPSLESNLRDSESVYDKIINNCGGKSAADKMWSTWKHCRNLLFHFFPDEKNFIDYAGARERLQDIFNTMDVAFKECRINYGKN